MRPAIFSQITLAAAVVSIVAVTGCSSAAPALSSSSNSSQSSPQEAEVAPPAPEPAPESTSETTPEPVAPAPTVIPGCEELVPIDVVRARTSEDYQYFPDDGVDGGEFHMQRMGPAAVAALDQALESQHCSWGAPKSENTVSVIVAELPEQARTELLAALRGSDFVETDVSGIPTFMLQTGEQLGIRYLWYKFSGDFLVSELTMSPEAAIGGDVVETLHRVNGG